MRVVHVGCGKLLRSYQVEISVESASSVSELALSLTSGPRPPDFVSVHCDANQDLSGILHVMDGDVALLGASSCLGTMTRDGPGKAASAFVIRDPDGSYGAAAVPMNGDPEGAARRAVLSALQRADRVGEMPELVWVSGTPGEEEAVLRGIESVTGKDVAIIGGSAADNTVEGGWFVFDRDARHSAGVAVAVLFPSRPVSFAYHNGYAPTDSTGRVTRSDGRRIYEIDGCPAASVYRDWTGGAVDTLPAGTDEMPILSRSTLWPLGRQVSDLGGVPFICWPIRRSPTHLARSISLPPWRKARF